MEKKEGQPKATVGIKWDAASEYGKGRDAPAKEVADWGLIKEEISKAQKAIIDASGAQVARDVIEVNIYGPACSDLTLIDLPGIVRMVGKDEKESLISDIEELNKVPRASLSAMHDTFLAKCCASCSRCTCTIQDA